MNVKQQLESCHCFDCCKEKMKTAGSVSSIETMFHLSSEKIWRFTAGACSLYAVFKNHAPPVVVRVEQLESNLCQFS